MTITPDELAFCRARLYVPALLGHCGAYHGFSLRDRRPAQCRQVDAVQCADRDAGGAGGELSLLHDRAERRPGRRAGCERLDTLAKIAGSAKIIPTQLGFVDIAGLVRGASKGEGLGNQFLGNIREVDAIVHVLRCFENDDIQHVDNKIDPLSDAETVETELMLSDLESLEKRVPAAQKKGGAGRQGSEDRRFGARPGARSCCARASRRG